MLKSYIFIPANNVKFITNVTKLNADYYVFDLEESVSENEIEISISNLSDIVLEKNYYIRFPCDYENLNYNFMFLKKIVNQGFSKYVLPKIETLKDFTKVISLFNEIGLENVKYILLIENPLILLHLQSILAKYAFMIKSLMIGSHDYCNLVESKHDNYNLYYLRQVVITNAKAYNLEVIDTAMVNIKDKDNYQNECIKAFQMGFDGKVVLHPNQLVYLNTAKYYSESEIDDAIKVHKYLEGRFPEENIVVKIDNRIYEKVHMKRIFNIIRWNDIKSRKV